jgi:hypothetical protein
VGIANRRYLRDIETNISSGTVSRALAALEAIEHRRRSLSLRFDPRARHVAQPPAEPVPEAAQAPEPQPPSGDAGTQPPGNRTKRTKRFSTLSTLHSFGNRS